MRRTVFPSFLALILVSCSSAFAGPIYGKVKFAVLNHLLHGQLHDYTDNHGDDRRICSRVLGEKRDLYVYLPPGFDPRQRYPMILYLHGYIDDAQIAATRDLCFFDKAMAEGRCPPAIVVVPDGRYEGTCHTDLPLFDDDFPSLIWFMRWDHGFPLESNWSNTRAGRFRDYVLEDVLPFVEERYPIRPEAKAHAVMGFSMAGWGSYCLALKNKDKFGVVAGIMGAMNMRLVDRCGRYEGKFDPETSGWRMELNHNEIIANWFGVKGSLRRAIEPYFGWGPEGLAWLIDENPVELLEPNDIRPGDLAMYVGSVDGDQFNMDDQAKCFIHVARQRGLDVTWDFRKYPLRRHTLTVALQFMPAAVEWVGSQLAPYSPPPCVRCK